MNHVRSPQPTEQTATIYEADDGGRNAGTTPETADERQETDGRREPRSKLGMDGKRFAEPGGGRREACPERNKHSSVTDRRTDASALAKTRLALRAIARKKNVGPYNALHCPTATVNFLR